jgi:hypothetical protein
MIPLGDDIESHRQYIRLHGGELTPFENFIRTKFQCNIQDLRDSLPHQIYISGGSILNFRKRQGQEVRQDDLYSNTDCDIYVHQRHELDVRQALVNQYGVYVPRPGQALRPDGQADDYYNIHAPAPANFFQRNFQEQLRRNNIGIVSNVMFGQRKVQIVGVLDDYPIEDVIRNFDFTICSLAYNLRTREFEPFQKQGEDIIRDIDSNIMHLRRKYIKFFMAPDLFGARLSFQRYRKYTDRGFRLINPSLDEYSAVFLQGLRVPRDPGAQEDE